MAEKRMFAKTIIDSDAFLDMPVTARLLYYDLAMRADDDGFVNSPKKIMRMIGVSQDDLSVLCVKKFVIPFKSGIVVIKHWRIHNYIRKDTYHETPYKDERNALELDENNIYQMIECEPSTERQRAVDDIQTQIRLDKISIDKSSIDEISVDESAAAPACKKTTKKTDKIKYAEFVSMTEADHKKLLDKYGEPKVKRMIEVLDNYKGSKGKTYKDDYRAILSWVVDKVEEEYRNGVHDTPYNANEPLFWGSITSSTEDNTQSVTLSEQPSGAPDQQSYEDILTNM
ncbi:MAG: replisome organizer [Ruminococcus sp.]|nr:replisome organizer [Ruminococcus sp.]